MDMGATNFRPVFGPSSPERVVRERLRARERAPSVRVADRDVAVIR